MWSTVPHSGLNATLYMRLSQLGITDEEAMNSHCKEMLELWSARRVRLVPERAG